MIRQTDLFKVPPPEGWRPSRGEWVFMATIFTCYRDNVAIQVIKHAWTAVVYKVRGEFVWVKLPGRKWMIKLTRLEALRPDPSRVGLREWDKVGGKTAKDVVNVYNAAEVIKAAEDRHKPEAWRELDFDD